MTSRQKISAHLLIVLSLLGGPVMVVCDEGAGRQVLEFLPQLCCGSADDVGSDAPAAAVEAESCGSCRDMPLALFLQREDECGQARMLLPRDVAEPPLTPVDLPLGRWAATTNAITFACSAPRVGLVGTVVLTC